MTTPTPENPEDGVLSAAIAWHTRLQDETAEPRVWEDFTVWLEADSAHRAAYDRVEDLQTELDGLAPQLKSTVGHAGDLQDTGTIVPLRLPQRRVVRAAVAGLGLMAASLLVAVGLHPYSPAPTAVYASAGGETRHVALEDGSAIDMAPGSRLDVAFRKGERRIRLDRGEAVFEVVHNAKRPFVVAAGDREIRDIGTVFNVLRDDGAVTVTVAEGMVRVASNGAVKTDSSPAGSAVPVQLAAGHQLVYRDGIQKSSLQEVDPSFALSWRDGYLAYDNAPLSQVVRDLNRYFAQPVSLGDAELETRRFSGILKIQNEDATIKSLTEIFSLATDQGDDGGIVLRSASDPEETGSSAQ